MRVLIAIEDESFASAIADFVSTHQWQAGTIIKILHVVELPFVGDQVTALYGTELQNEILKDRRDYGQSLVQQTKDHLEKGLRTSLPIETNVCIGRPHDTILHIAEDWKADMIVMGSHGRTGFNRFLLGSISLAVLSHANCSVVIVRLPAHTKNVNPALEDTQTLKQSSQKVMQT